MLPPFSSAVQGGEFTCDEIGCALALIQLSNTQIDPLEREQLYSLVKKSEDKPTCHPSEQNRNLSDQEKPLKWARIMSLALKPRWVLAPETGKDHVFGSKTQMVVLIRGWMRFVSAHELKKGDSVAVWMFRRKDRKALCFTIKILKPDDED